MEFGKKLISENNSAHIEIKLDDLEKKLLNMREVVTQLIKLFEETCDRQLQLDQQCKNDRVQIHQIKKTLKIIDEKYDQATQSIDILKIDIQKFDNDTQTIAIKQSLQEHIQEVLFKKSFDADLGISELKKNFHISNNH
jgi:hypothetical protein